VTALDHQVIVKELPKTKQAHLIRLDSGTIAMLKRLRAQQAEAKLRLGPGYQDEGNVFCQFDGRPHHPERFSREFDRKQRYFNRHRADHQLPAITLHGLRHTWATLALGAGIDIKIVSERLNHSSTHITREIYTHVTPPMQSDAAERVGKLIHGS
jgi:integrase